jgi:two-component system chemotaxis sensor kinase CheA
MAIVKERVERLGGEVGVETRTGAGTSIRMILPTTIATFRGLLVRARGSAFLLPVDAVVRAVRVAGAALGRVEGREALSLDGRVVPAARLADLLSLPRGADGASPSRSHHLGVILRSGSDLAGVLVDDVLGDREVLLKDLRAPLVRVRHVAGLGLLGTGEGAVILRPGDLVRAAMEARGPEPSRAEPAGARRAPVVLVVDDSITTRTMEKNLLEAAGYEVRVAADGVEAWTAVKTGSFDLVISDVDMPRLDGFGLTERIREDRELADLPVVLVTALESREDKERGIEVGANAYVIKSSFDQSNLLEIIRRLV